MATKTTSGYGKGTMKTIKQIADEIGIDKQKVYRFVKRNHISEAHQKQGILLYDEAVQTLIHSHFTKNTASNEAHQSTSFDAVNDVLIKMLQQELEAKNKQIEELTAIVREQAESINADRKNELAGTLIDGKQQFLSDGTVDPEKPEPERRGFFGWFKSKRPV